MRKVIVKKPPVGSNLTHSLNGGNFQANPHFQQGEPDIRVRKSLGPVPRQFSNVEAEKGETVVGDLNKDSFPEFYTIQGKKHSQGGTPLSLPDASFIFSADKAMMINDPDILKMFGKNSKKKGYLPTDLAKNYDLNNYRKLLQDPNSDKRQVHTAEKMIENYNKKLGKLAIYQESMKGFPQGIPAIAQPYLESSKINPADFVHQEETPEIQTQTAKYGSEIMSKLLKTNHFGKKKMQMGGDTGNGKRSNVYGMAGDDYLKRLSQIPNVDYEKSLPFTFGTAEFNRKSKQGRVAGTKNIYGDQNWAQGQYWEDFKRRHGDYLAEFKKKTGKEFDPENKTDVNDFQTTYNQYAKNVGLPNYFSEKGKPGTGYDKLFGEHTFSAPSLTMRKPADTPAIETPQDEPPVDKIGTYQQPDIPNAGPGKAPEWWLQDIVKVKGAAGDMNRIKKYTPYVPNYHPVLADPTFYDPTRQLAANAEQANIASQAVSAFSGAQGTYRLSGTQSLAGKQAADTLSQYNNMNVGVANQFEQQRAQQLSQANMVNRGLSESLYDKNTIANQQFDNAKAMARQNLRQSYIDAVTNRANSQVLNSMFENYNISPLSGGMMNFTHGRPLTGGHSGGSGQEDLMGTYQDYMSYGNMTPEVAWQMSKKTHGVNDNSDELLQNYLMMTSGYRPHYSQQHQQQHGYGE